jgi:hypothetical protein
MHDYFPSGCVLSGEAAYTSFIVFGLTRLGFEPMIYRTRGEHANSTDAVDPLRKYIQTKAFFSFYKGTVNEMGQISVKIESTSYVYFIVCVLYHTISVPDPFGFVVFFPNHHFYISRIRLLFFCLITENRKIVPLFHKTYCYSPQR